MAKTYNVIVEDDSVIEEKKDIKGRKTVEKIAKQMAMEWIERVSHYRYDGDEGTGDEDEDESEYGWVDVYFDLDQGNQIRLHWFHDEYSITVSIIENI